MRFGLVGLSGLLVNSAVLWLCVHSLGWPAPLASIPATETAILSNFVLNDRWTFAGAGAPGIWARLLRFNSVALGGMLITALLLGALTGYARLPLLAANVLAVAGAMAWNYLANARWTWRAPGVAAPPECPPE